MKCYVNSPSLISMIRIFIIRWNWECLIAEKNNNIPAAKSPKLWKKNKCLSLGICKKDFVGKDF